MMMDDTSQNKEGSCGCLSLPGSDSALSFQVTREPVCVGVCVCTSMRRHIPVHMCACMHMIMCTCFCMSTCVWAPYVFYEYVLVCVCACFVPVCMCIVGNLFFQVIQASTWFIILLLWVISAQSNLFFVINSYLSKSGKMALKIKDDTLSCTAPFIWTQNHSCVAETCKQVAELLLYQLG